MRVLFFTPCLLVSAIARVSNLIVDALVEQGHVVTVVRTEDEAFIKGQTYIFNAEIICWNNIEKVNYEVSNSQLLIYQVGDNYQYHRGCLEWLVNVPGVVCLHDNFIGHLFWSWAEKIGRPTAKDILIRLYGDAVAASFFNHNSSADFIEYASKRAPMTEWIAEMATALVVHSSWAFERIVKVARGPVEVIPLPYDKPVATSDDKSKNSANDKFTLLTIGHVNQNKRYESIIRAISNSNDLKQKILFRIVGSVEPSMREFLQSLADKFSVNVAILGPVDSQQLVAEIESADIMCCLRWPALESASASTIEAMLYGKAIIVTNTGFYSELPSECVLKVDPENELDHLQSALESLISSSRLREDLGLLAQKFAFETFRADTYAVKILTLPARINRTNLICVVANGFANQLKRWGARKSSLMIGNVVAPLDIFY